MCRYIHFERREPRWFIFRGESTSSLSAMRCKIFTKKFAAAKFFVTPERLPPTESATKFHRHRVHYQVMVWMGIEDDLDPLDWGWGLKESRQSVRGGELMRRKALDSTRLSKAVWVELPQIWEQYSIHGRIRPLYRASSWEGEKSGQDAIGYQTSWKLI